ncbi:MAG: 3-dehydroquinate synthase [Flexistipes sinusarabici]|uniref:3-dehydroquinate synthase n=1 Tax=Flexistipes sinusarabici TaxID=2352 RepID=A0A5D0MUJ4_FLESI|nr:3-dehydroquinate synthase [Flexistipes sinusarabici]TYB35810.1 MAG: 3-dehydroquinate synthase [Flexistipes sinusarabici]
MDKVFVDLKKEVDYSYEILIGTGFIGREISSFEAAGNALFLVDENVYNLYSELFSQIPCFVYRAEENRKNFDSVKDILSFFKKKGAHRKNVLVSVGGGITGDVGGFAASVYMRGVPFVNVPTTFLSMVDSSVGGKTGINFDGVKNLVGAFYQPQKVLIDTEFLDTLSDEEFMSGFAEVIKYAAIFDKDFFDELKRPENLKNSEFLKYTIRKCCEIKAEIVKLDEREGGVRRLLNFGHTVGHAVEIDSVHRVKHGHAVAIGMYYETLFAFRKGEAGKEMLEELREMLSVYQYDIDYKISNEALFLDALKSDKKASDNKLVLAVAPHIGKGSIIEDVCSDELMECVKESV